VIQSTTSALNNQNSHTPGSINNGELQIPANVGYTSEIKNLWHVDSQDYTLVSLWTVKRQSSRCSCLRHEGIQGNKGIAPLINNLGTRGMCAVNLMPLLLYSWERTSAAIKLVAGRSPEPVWALWQRENLLLLPRYVLSQIIHSELVLWWITLQINHESYIFPALRYNCLFTV